MELYSRRVNQLGLQTQSAYEDLYKGYNSIDANIKWRRGGGVERACLATTQLYGVIMSLLGN